MKILLLGDVKTCVGSVLLENVKEYRLNSGNSLKTNMRVNNGAV